jgi:Fe-Mn family superoxide dismutase
MAGILKTMSYKTKKFEHLFGTKGFSDELFKNHFKLYEGYVANMNKLNDVLVEIEKEGKWNIPEFAELNRHLGWEFNGMRLHELYFDNISKEKKELNQNSELFKKIITEWGSFDMWEKDFRAMGMIRGIGWIVLYYDKIEERLFNIWIGEHDIGHLTGATPLLVMDVFEHAYISDYGLARGEYIDVFMNAINWNEVEKRAV